MATKALTIPFELREKTGTSSAHALRAAGKVPAVVYGHGVEPQHVALDAKAFDEALHHGGRTGIVTLSENGKNVETALVREIQINPVSQKVFHVDLQRVGVHESVHAKLPVVMVGVARGVKDSGGVMDVIAHELEIEGPADELPDRLEIDVAGLGIHEHVVAGDVKLPKGFKMLTAADTTVVVIEASRTASQVEEAALPAEQLQPEVIGQKSEGE